MKPRVGRYRLLSRLAQGGMAQVYLAEQKGLDGFTKKVVLKKMLAGHRADTSRVEMFSSEAVLAGQLDHPNIVHVYDFAEVNGERIIVMEYVDGPSLKRLLQLGLKRGVRLPIEHCLKIASCICEGLTYAHAKVDDRTGEPMRLVHRDITPDNVLIARNGSVKIADFGILKAQTQLHETRIGEVKGKMAYIAPEQLLSQPLDGRADLFSLGVVLHEALTGQSPFMRENDAAIIEAIQHDEVPPLNALRPEAPPALDAIIRKATAKRREDRFNSALEMQDAIERALVKLTPVFVAARLRELVEAWDPYQPGEPEETTTTDSAPVEAFDEPGTDVAPSAPVGRRMTREVEAIASVEIPITGMSQAYVPPDEPVVPAPPPSAPTAPIEVDTAPVVVRPRSVVVPVISAAVTAAALAVAATLYLVPRPAVIIEHVEAPVEQKPAVVARVPDVAPPQPVPQRPEEIVDAGVAVAAVEAPVEKPVEAPVEKPVEAPVEKPKPAVPAGHSRVTLQSEPEATVFIDGKSYGPTPINVVLPAGAHKLRFEDKMIGLNKSVALKVPDAPELVQAFVFEKARLFVMAPDGATVFVDKRKAAKVPQPVQLYEGSYSVRVVYEPTELDMTRRIEMKGGDRFEPFVPE